MSKNKKKGSKKEKPSPDLFVSATLELKRFRRFAKQVRKLSTTQKVVGSLALLAAGYALITKTSASEAPAEAPAPDELAPAAPNTAPNPGPQASTPKPRRTKPTGTSPHSPFSQERP